MLARKKCYLAAVWPLKIAECCELAAQQCADRSSAAITSVRLARLSSSLAASQSGYGLQHLRLYILDLFLLLWTDPFLNQINIQQF